MVCMGPSHFIACNDRTVYSWQFSSISQNVAAAVNSYKRGGDDIDSNDAGKNIFVVHISCILVFNIFLYHLLYLFSIFIYFILPLSSLFSLHVNLFFSSHFKLLEFPVLNKLIFLLFFFP